MALTDFRAIYLPYCLKQQEDGSFLVLNRDYKPVGFNTIENVDYDSYPIRTKFKRMTEKVASELSWSNSPSLSEIHLYNDKTNPLKSDKDMKAYLKKLKRLSKLKVKE